MAGRGSGAACFVEGGSGGWEDKSQVPKAESQAPIGRAGLERPPIERDVVVDRTGDRWRSQVRFHERRDPAKTATGSAGRGRNVFPSRRAARRAGRAPMKVG